MGTLSEPTQREKAYSMMQFHSIHANEACLVCALGPSITLVTREIRQQCKTIGVNYIGRWFTPDYCLILDKLYPDTRYGDDRDERNQLMTYNNKAKFTFSKYSYMKCTTNWVPIKTELIKRIDCGACLRNHTLFGFCTSTISAISLAMYMGFTKIGIIGFDIQGHTIEKKHKELEVVMETIMNYSISQGIEMLNLSPHSLLQAIPSCSIEDFISWYGASR